MKTAAELFAEAKSRITEIAPDEVRAERAAGADFALIDVREPNEWQMGRIPGAVLLPRGVLESGIEARVPRERRVVLYCASGNRSAMAAESLGAMGYGQVQSLRGGIKGWVDVGGEIES